jgi:hypothetical protein
MASPRETAVAVVTKALREGRITAMEVSGLVQAHERDPISTELAISRRLPAGTGLFSQAEIVDLREPKSPGTGLFDGLDD